MNMQLKPSEIRFSQDSINNYFDQRSRHSYKRIGDTLDDICEGRCSIHQIPTITVVNENGHWITADNRRLWVFRELERLGKCDEIPVYRGYHIPEAKRTSYNDGKSIYVRRDPGGRWHSKPTVTKPLDTRKAGIQNEYNTHTIPFTNIENIPRRIQPVEQVVSSHVTLNPTSNSTYTKPYEYRATQDNSLDENIVRSKSVVETDSRGTENAIAEAMGPRKNVIRASNEGREPEKDIYNKDFKGHSSNSVTSTYGKAKIPTAVESYGFEKHSAISNQNGADHLTDRAKTNRDYIRNTESKVTREGDVKIDINDAKPQDRSAHGIIDIDIDKDSNNSNWLCKCVIL